MFLFFAVLAVFLRQYLGYSHNDSVNSKFAHPPTRAFIRHVVSESCKYHVVGPEFLNLIIHSCNSFLHLYLDKAELILFNKLEAKFSRVFISLSIFESQIVGRVFRILAWNSLVVSLCLSWKSELIQYLVQLRLFPLWHRNQNF